MTQLETDKVIQQVTHLLLMMGAGRGINRLNKLKFKQEIQKIISKKSKNSLIPISTRNGLTNESIYIFYISSQTHLILSWSELSIKLQCASVKPRSPEHRS